ncbi:short-chain fatty acid transporter [Crocinitomix catalasitica]|nr:short-chain fatty acid transporter [Crocinitomix catalasitica]
MSFVDKFANTYKKLLPTPFTIALLLTALTFILALIFTKPEDAGFGEYTLTLASKWEEGLWNEGKGGLYFAFQMMLMLVLGYILALSKSVSALIDKLTAPCTTTANTAAIVTLATICVSLFNWGLGLIFGAILARKVGEKFNRENRPLNYPLIGAAAYSGLMVWHGGISGSAPIKAAESGNLKSLVEKVEGIDLASIPDRVDMSATIFSGMNITVSIMLLILIPGLMYLMGKRKESDGTLPKAVVAEDEKTQEKIEGAEKLDHSIIFSSIIGSLILIYAFYKAVILPNELSLSFLTPNFINFFLLGLGIMLHFSISKFIKAANNAIVSATGILLQFPLYFGILGLMVGSGLINEISDLFVSVSTDASFPIYTFFSAGLVNVFVPSGGGQWAVQGPIIIASAQELGVSLPKAIMALSYGDQLTNMIQPFWALPLLGITGLRAKEILPYTLLLFVGGGLIFLLGLMIF